MVNKPLFSIIVPIYNARDYLERCVQSLVSQTYSRIEIILVNDGSTDGSGELAESLRLKNEQIQVFHKKNGGVSDARNFGIHNSSGEYLLFVDSDDAIHEDTCKTFYKVIMANKPNNLDVVGGNNWKISSSNKVEMKFAPTENKIAKGSEFFLQQIRRGSFKPYVWRYIFRREFIVNNALFFTCGLIHEDAEWLPRSLILAEKMATIDLSYYYYYSRDGSLSRGENQLGNAIHIIRGCHILLDNRHLTHDKEVRLALNDFIVKQYLSAVWRGRLHTQENKKFLCQQFLKLRVLTSKTRLLKNICRINAGLYVVMRDMYVWFYRLSSAKRQKI